MSTPKKSVKQTIEEATLKTIQAQVRAVLVDQMTKATPTTNTKATTPKAPNAKVAAIENVLSNRPWGSSETRRNVAEIVSILLDQLVGQGRPSSSSAGSQVFMTVVPVKPTPGYVTGKPAMFKSNGGTHGVTLSKDGKVYREDNSLPMDELGNVKVLRYATKLEIVDFVKKLTSTFNNVQRLRGYLGGNLNSLLS
jgi:hypothetical protein